MSGSGGYFTRHDLETSREEATRRLEQAKFDATINSLLQHELIAVNDRDIDVVNAYLERIESALGDEVESFDRILFGGSVAKHTYVDGLSDVDSLVLLQYDSLEGKNPADVLSDFRDTLMRKLPRGAVVETHVGTMAVTVEYRDGTEIQLLPAVESGDRIFISSADGTSWTRIQPRQFAQRLTGTNQNQGGAVIPAIKLAKSILANRLGDHAPSGYHVEALAVAAFRDYTGPRTPKAMVTHLIESASANVLRPILDVTGQSQQVDEYLGAADSSQRRTLARALRGIARTMSTSRSVEDWRGILD